MNELFEKKSLPFYKFGYSIYLPKISTADWILYIYERFDSTDKSISKELTERVWLAVDNHSSYVQQLAWLLWIQIDGEATEQNFADAHKDLIDQNTPLFEKQTENLSAYQMNFLRALVDGAKSLKQYGANAFLGRGVERLTDDQREIKHLQTELKDKELDVEILKKR